MTWIERSVITCATRGVRPHPSKQRCPGWRAERLCDIGPLKNHRLRCQFIQVGRVDTIVAIAGHGIEPLLVGQEKNQVRFAHRGESSAYVRNEKKEKQTSLVTCQQMRRARLGVTGKKQNDSTW